MSARVGIVACGALTLHLRAAAGRLGAEVDIHPLPPQLHNRPERIPPAVEALLDQLDSTYDRLAIAYADCGTYGALDDVCRRRGIPRLVGGDCYTTFAGSLVEDLRRDQPGTFFLTDFLARTFRASVWRPLGLDRHPELRDDYFAHYTRVVWLAQRPTPFLAARAAAAAHLLRLPLETIEVGESGLDRDLAALLADA